MTADIIAMLESWKLPHEQIFALLAIDGKPRDLRKYRLQGKSLPWSPETAERAEHLLGVNAALLTANPKCDAIQSFWLRKPHRRFNNRPPLLVMLQDGLPGLVQVRVEVDCTYAWSQPPEADRSRDEG